MTTWPSATHLAAVGEVFAPGTTALTAAAALSGACVGLGLTMLVAWLWPGDHQNTEGSSMSGWTRLTGPARDLVERLRHGDPALLRRVAVTVAVFVGVGLVTRWPVAVVLAGIGAWTVPGLWRPDAVARAGTDTLEAIAVWTEMLRDTLSAAAGLEQAILASATITPPALAGPVTTLTQRIRAGQSLPVALRAFADDVDDPTADLVVAALVLASSRQARDLTGLLSTLAQAARDQVVLRLRVAAGRARIRTSVRIILLTTLGMATALVVLNRGYLAAYDTAEGQLVLLLVGALFAAGFAWLNRIAAMPPNARVLKDPGPADSRAEASGAGPGGVR